MTTNSLKLKAFAKINLFLEICSIMDNGYHQLESIMQSVSLHDDVLITKTNGKEIIVKTNNIDIPNGEKNIAYKAAKALLNSVEMPLGGLEISINKNIPHEAGLAGGSADAAAVLVGINSLLNLGLSKTQLAEIGKTIGADVPFCVHGGTAMTEGIGEIITPVKSLTEVDCWIVIVKPECSFKTADAFKKYDNSEELQKNKKEISVILENINNLDIKQIGSNLYNIFERITGNHETEKIKALMLSNGSLGAVMTGSGSSVIGIFDDLKIAQECQTILKKQYNKVFLTTPVEYGVEY